MPDDDYPASAWDAELPEDTPPLPPPAPGPTTARAPGTFRQKMARAGLAAQLVIEWAGPPPEPKVETYARHGEVGKRAPRK